MASKFSRANPRGSIILWQLAQTVFARCCSIRSRMVSGFAPGESGSAGTSGGGGGGGEQLEDAAILLNDAADKQIQLTLESLAQGVVEIGKVVLVRRRAAQIANV